MKDVTDRESYLIEQALFYAAHFIDGLPNEYRARSNRDDMVRLLRARLGDDFMSAAELHGSVLAAATRRPFNVEEY